MDGRSSRKMFISVIRFKAGWRPWWSHTFHTMSREGSGGVWRSRTNLAAAVPVRTPGVFVKYSNYRAKISWRWMYQRWIPACPKQTGPVVQFNLNCVYLAGREWNHGAYSTDSFFLNDLLASDNPRCVLSHHPTVIASSRSIPSFISTSGLWACPVWAADTVQRTQQGITVAPLFH